MHPLKSFYTPLSGALQKCFKSGPALANASLAFNRFYPVYAIYLVPKSIIKCQTF